ncbi:prespore specific transcriptional activator RsfA [Bacillus thuringiensis serovar tolworthi]|uniref:Prespore specific transcriptional activator RsfA n=1 Tax=Bacillus thuringiensis subsp. tolworthi TaxID=1442 RepID=A0A9W3ZR58_BACTO|nr:MULTISPECIES: RsfA family transcriptional regulator [Bacillus cereus group]MEB8711396.1 RsfA family transcriptional regulator [Bacillus cereus]MRB01634.1 RsfA family transcriptional regulator [Bacillus thuringiensis]MEB9434093.1 RsfA family transcriptional regulator [Bacillus cereus]MEB9479165.1 RsfA family transcriptional regulator [Bacillus cereus]MEB9589882.1 RsfA family transcriptional regulator [Bacillus cereus]
MKVRQDAWTDEDDLLLAETVLRHVREGSTQLNAFEEVGDQLNRTSAACGFRWNAVVRYSYEQALQLAKKHRKDKMRAASGEQAKKRLLYTPPASDSITDYEELVQYKEAIPYQESTAPAARSSMTMQDVIYFLQTVGSSNIKVTALENENTRLKQEIKAQILRNEELEKKLEKLEKQSHTVQEDYETLMNIMNRARKLAVMDDEERSQTSFRMDRNGNLEKIAE